MILGVAEAAEALVGVGAGRVRLVGFEVGRGGVEEEEVDLQVEQVGERPLDLLGKLSLDLQQPVHGPIAAVVVEFDEAGDHGLLGHPGRAAKLGHGF